MQKILITGSNGLLGQKLVYKLKDNTTITCIASARGENRLVNKSGYEYLELITRRHDCIYNTHDNGIARFYKTCHFGA